MAIILSTVNIAIPAPAVPKIGLFWQGLSINLDGTALADQGRTNF
jgi:hypothetical protein